MRKATETPQHGIYEQAIVRRRSTYILHTARQRIHDPLPLRFTQLIPTRCHEPSATKYGEAAKTYLWISPRASQSLRVGT